MGDLTLPAKLTDAALFAVMPVHGDLCIHAAVDLKRTFSQDELERAVAATVRDFPVLGCRYEPRFWRDRWVPVDAPIGAIVHDGGQPADVEAETIAWVRRPIDGTRDRPLRIVSMKRGEGSRLLLSVLHLAVDGSGAAAVAHVLGSHLYGALPGVSPDAERGLRGALGRLSWAHLPVLAKDAVVGMLQPLRTVLAAKRERPFPKGPTLEASWRHLVVSAAELARVRERAGARGARVNDLVVAAAARAAGTRSSDGPVVVLYTMDLRRYARAPRLTATNTSTFLAAFVPRADLATLASAVSSVAAITAGHRRGLAGPAFLLGPVLLSIGTPHAAVRRLVRHLQTVAVDLPLSRGMIITNVGRLDDGLKPFADDLEDIRIIGPIVENVDVPAVVAFGFRGQLCLELFAPPGLAAEALDELEAELRAALELE